jgi:hypothetical protein
VGHYVVTNKDYRTVLPKTVKHPETVPHGSPKGRPPGKKDCFGFEAVNIPIGPQPGNGIQGIDPEFRIWGSQIIPAGISVAPSREKKTGILALEGYQQEIMAFLPEGLGKQSGIMGYSSTKRINRAH